MTHWTEETFVERAEVFATNFEARMDEASTDITHLLDLAESHGIEPDTVLDVPCGIGRHAAELAARDIDVHGVDLSPEYVDSAIERAADRGVADATRFFVGDMRELSAVDGLDEGGYDLVLNCWTSFGYFDDATNEAVAEALYRRVGADGALVLELTNKTGVLANFCSSTVAEHGDTLHLERRSYEPETGRMESEITILREDEANYERVGEMTWDLRLYGPAELRRLLERAGFETIRCYAGLDGDSLDPTSTRMAVVAKP